VRLPSEIHRNTCHLGLWKFLQIFVVLFVISRILKNNQLIGAIPSTLSQLPNLKIL
jgi:hypothetical protein